MHCPNCRGNINSTSAYHRCLHIPYTVPAQWTVTTRWVIPVNLAMEGFYNTECLECKSDQIHWKCNKRASFG